MMNVRNSRFGKIKLLLGTTLTLLFSVAQSDEHRLQSNDLVGISLADRGFNLGYSEAFVDIDKSGLPGDSNANLAVTGADRFGQLSLIEMNTDETNRMHFNFKSNITNEIISATLVSDGPAYSLTFDMPSGQVLLENGMVSVITPTNFSQLSLSENQIPDRGNGHFSALLNETIRGSDLAGFSMSMADSLAESSLSSVMFLEDEYSKERRQYVDGAWACAGAFLALAAANAALAAAIALTYASYGLMIKAIALAISAVGAAISMVDQYCMQM